MFSPGVRVGWVHAPHPILYRINLVKQANDLCTSTFAQLLALRVPAARAARRGACERLRHLYRSRRDAMVAAMRDVLPDAAFTAPAGGLFLWATLADGLDTTDLLAAALERNVAFVPGVAAYVDGVRARRRCGSTSRPATRSGSPRASAASATWPASAPRWPARSAARAGARA